MKVAFLPVSCALLFSPLQIEAVQAPPEETGRVNQAHSSQRGHLSRVHAPSALISPMAYSFLVGAEAIDPVWNTTAFERAMFAAETRVGIQACNGSGRQVLERFVNLRPYDPCLHGIELMVWFAGFALFLLLGGAAVLMALLWNASSSSSGADEEIDHCQIAGMASRLENARKSGYIARLKLSGPVVVCGVALIAWGIPTGFVYSAHRHVTFLKFTTTVTYMGHAIILSALLPTDSNTIRTVAWTMTFLLAWNGFMYASIGEHYTIRCATTAPYCKFRACEYGVAAVLNFASVAYQVFILCSASTRLVLRRTMVVVGVIQLFTLVRMILHLAVAPALQYDNLIGWYFKQPSTIWAAVCFQAVFDVFTIALCFSDRVSARLQELLTSNSEQAMTAAGVSQLLSDDNPAAVIERARTMFLCVPADRLTREDMTDNIPNPRLRIFAEPAQLGEVDAFISHSWHDDAEAKWNSIQAWREQFKECNGREPTFWIDKYCIDQNNITVSLSCLPVFLAGCKNVVAFVGETYLTRLWCVMEIFIFVEMELESDNFTMVSISDRDSLMSEIQDYDIRKAHCFTPEDTERLMHVIDAAQGGVSKTLTRFVKKKSSSM